MASKDPEEVANTATDEETLAFKKKRARRVSFADVEITSVHIFKRDEEYETPPESQHTPETARPDDEVLGFFRDLVDSDDDSGESSPNEDDDAVGQRKSFLRPLGSPSPGSSTAGSVTSIDEDNFFGPVSAGFIRPGRLSDSAASDANHDVTMDSTTFSMHFRSLAGSDSGRELKTPTVIRLASEERTPTQNSTPSKPDGFMALTKAKKLISPSSQTDDLVGSKDSNAMSIVGDNSHKFEYGRLSPTLDALLTEGSKDLYATSNNEKSPNGNGPCEIDQIGREDNADEIVKNIEFENGSDRFNKHAIAMSIPNHEGIIIRNGTPCNVIQSIGLLQENLSDGRGTKDFPMDKRHETDTNLDYKLQYVSPLKRSLSTELKTFPTTPNSPALAALVTSNLKLLDYGFSTGSMKVSKGLSSKQKSIPKFRLPEPSPCALSVKEGISRLKSRLSSYSSMANLSDQPGDLQCKHMDIPVVCLEELLRPNMNHGENETSFSIYGSGLGASEDMLNLSQNEEVQGSIQFKETPIYVSTPDASKVQPSKLTGEAESPSKVSWSRQREVFPRSLISENPIVGFCPSRGIDALLPDVISDEGEQRNPTRVQDSLVTFPSENLDARLSKVTECQSSCFGELKHQGQGMKQVSACLTQGEDATVHNTPTSPLTSLADKISPLQSETEANSTSPILKAFSLAIEADNVGDYLSNFQNNSENYSNLKLSSREGGTLNSQFISASQSLKVGTDPLHLHKAQTREPMLLQSPSKEVPNQNPRENFPSRTFSGTHSAEKAILRKSSMSPSKKVLSQSSSRKEPAQNSLRSEFSDETLNDVALMTKDMGSPTSCSRGHIAHDFDRANPTLESSSRKTNHSLSGNKRRNTDIIALEGDHDDANKRSKKIGGDKTFMPWTDVSENFLADTQSLLPPLINELNTKAIDKLEDTLVHLSKVKEYELLCSDIQSQKVAENFRGTLKRVVEARLLMCKVAYKKAKLQLMCAKRDGYMKRAESLSSHIENFQKLNLNHDQVMEPCSKGSQVDDSNGHACSDSSEVKHEEPCDRISKLRREFETLDGKVKILSKSLSTYCKLKGEKSSNDILASVIDHVRKRKLCRSICQDMQMWEVYYFEKKNDHYSVHLNYLGYASQRFTIKASPFPGVAILNTLNETYIDKNFPEMNACSAFAFVLDVERTRKCIASRHLSKETQMTSSFIRNLLDVIEEVQVAQIEITNLILTRFHSLSDQQLDLQLRFIDFDSGRKLTLILDVSDLNQGIYPFEVTPHKIEPPSFTQYTLPDSLLNDVRTAVEGLDAGYSRILRMCRCVSKVIQVSSR